MLPSKSKRSHSCLNKYDYRPDVSFESLDCINYVIWVISIKLKEAAGVYDNNSFVFLANARYFFGDQFYLRISVCSCKSFQLTNNERNCRAATCSQKPQK